MSQQILRRGQALVSPRAERLVSASFFLVAITLGAYVAIPLPFTPVPLTAQTFFVLLGAAVLGRKWGLGVQGTYLLLAGAGMPLLAGGVAGLAAFKGVTAGYLAGFLPATWLVASRIQSCSGIFSRFMLFSAGSLIILICGSAWLMVLMGLTPLQALLMGLVPFLAGDLAKSALAAGWISWRLGRKS